MRRDCTQTFSMQNLEPRLCLNGVTIITHGFNSGAGEGSWIDNMADAIAERAGGDFEGPSVHDGH